MKRLQPAQPSADPPPKTGEPGDGVEPEVETEDQTRAREEEVMRRDARRSLQASIVGLGQVTMLQVKSLHDEAGGTPGVALALMGSSFLLSGQLQRLAAINAQVFTIPAPKADVIAPSKIQVNININDPTSVATPGGGAPVTPGPTQASDVVPYGSAAAFPADDPMGSVASALDDMYGDDDDEPVEGSTAP